MTDQLKTDPLIDTDDLTVSSEDQVAMASARIRAYCRWHIYPSIDETVTLDGPGQRFLMLPSLYLTDVEAVTEDGVTLLSTEYEWSVSGQLWRNGLSWSGHFRSIVVEMTHGYEVLPEELREVALALATRLPAQLVGVTQQSAGSVSQTYGGLLSGQASLSASFTAAEQMALDRYRIPSRP